MWDEPERKMHRLKGTHSFIFCWMHVPLNCIKCGGPAQAVQRDIGQFLLHLLVIDQMMS